MAIYIKDNHKEQIKEQDFKAFEKVRLSAKVNMIDTAKVSNLSRLGIDKVKSILKNYDYLSTKFTENTKQTEQKAEHKAKEQTKEQTTKKQITKEQTAEPKNNSLIPALKESERFIKFLGDKFSLDLPNDFIVVINKTSKNVKGHFADKKVKEWENGKGVLRVITLSSYHLKDTPYITLAHELAHFVNNLKGIKDCSTNQYHNKHFKESAELLKLGVEKGKRGYSTTTETEEFKELLEEFKPNENAFSICQKLKEKGKTGTRLYLWTCGGKCFKVRCGEKSLNITCNLCQTPFERVEK